MTGLQSQLRRSRAEHLLFAAREPIDGDDRGFAVLLLGEDNPQSARPEHQLFDYPANCAGHRLRNAILRVPSALYLSCWRGNLCVPTWSEKQAAETAAKVFTEDAPWRVVVMLGRKVARVVAKHVGTREIHPFSRRAHGVFSLVSLPHPSGVCRVWNDAKAYDRALATMRAAAPSLPWGSEPWT